VGGGVTPVFYFQICELVSSARELSQIWLHVLDLLFLLDLMIFMPTTLEGPWVR
jgi:hypothetical protein